MQIVNESDRDVTWWCYNSDATVREFTLPGGAGDLAKGGRASYNPPANATGLHYVQFTLKGGHLTYAQWKPSNQWTFARCPMVRRDQTLIFRGSCGYEAITAETGSQAR